MSKREIRAWYREFKENASCVYCGINHPAVIEFHHREPLEKIDTIHAMIIQGYDLTSCKAEMTKCDPVCKNCHAMLHWDQEKKTYQQYGTIMRGNTWKSSYLH